MNREFIKHEIRNIMETINEQQSQVLAYQGKIPQLEMDLLLENLRRVYERLTELHKAEFKAAPVIVPESKSGMIFPDELIATVSIPPAEEKINLQEERMNTISINKVSEVIAEMTANGEAHVQQEIIPEKTEVLPAAAKIETSPEPVVQQEVVTKERTREFSKPANKMGSGLLFDDAPTIGGTFHGSKTIYDKITVTQEVKSIGGQLQKNPVSDLKKSIGINEKFAFINELFDGNLENYNEAIEKLNSSGNLDDALTSLNTDIAPQYGWNNSGTTFLQLKNLLERRFSA